MDPSDYENTLGAVVKENGYYVFMPGPIPPKIEYDMELVNLLSRTERLLGEIKRVTESFPETVLIGQVFIHMEALESSRIEGTRAVFTDMLKYDLDKLSASEARLLRIQEVINYKNIMLQKWKSDDRLDLESIKEMQKNLLLGVDPRTEFLGIFRPVQNWIGGRGRMGDSTYNPPPPRNLQPLMEELESFINDGSGMPDLIRCAIAHYQFESIHPFHDGNGRVGRMMTGIMLARMAELPWPLDISTYLKRDQIAYYSRLLGVSTRGEWQKWLVFFVSIVHAAATGVMHRANRLHELVKEYREISSRSHAIRLVELLLASPYVTIPNVRKSLSMSYPGAKDLVEEFIMLGILVELETEKRPRLFCARDILKTIVDTDLGSHF